MKKRMRLSRDIGRSEIRGYRKTLQGDDKRKQKG